MTRWLSPAVLVAAGVPKLLGIGWTLNFAHRRAWLWLALLLSPALVVAAIALAGAR